MAQLDKAAYERIKELEAELESQEILNAILDAENIELREEVKLLRRRVQLEQQNRQLADVI